MAVSSPTAPARDQTGPIPGHRPVRTCIGCRRRAAAAELLRVVASGPFVVPDPRHRAPGRGAWLHYDLGCVDLAERRRTFGRALRVPGQLDPAPVRECVAASGAREKTRPAENRRSDHSYGQSMKRQQ